MAKQINLKLVRYEIKTGKLLHDETAIIARWLEYLSDLYHDPQRASQAPRFLGTDCYELLQDEVQNTIKQLPTNKAPGIDGMKAELLKALEEEPANSVIETIQQMYSQRKVPMEFYSSRCVLLPKKS